MQTATTLTPSDEAARAGRITSTRIVRLVNGRQTAVYNEMTGIAEPLPDSAMLFFGRHLQRPIIDAAAMQRGWKVLHEPGTIVSKTHPRYATSADALVLPEDRVIEAKNRAGWRASEYAGEPLQDELVQVQWHMDVMGMPRASVVVLLGGHDLRIFDVDRDEELCAGLREIADRFLRDYYDAGRAPPLDASDAAAEYLRKRFPADTEPMLAADEQLDALVAEYRAACEAADAADERKGIAGNRLREAIGTHSGIEGTDYRINYKAARPSIRTDWEAVIRDLAIQIPADVLEKHSVTKPGPRSLRPTWR